MGNFDDEYLRNEVSTYSAWCNGEVYRYDLISIDGEITDSCGGFIDSVEYVKGEAKRAVDESL